MSNERWYWVAAVVSSFGPLLFQARSPERPGGGFVRVRRLTSVASGPEGVGVKPHALGPLFGESAEIAASGIVMWSELDPGLAATCDRLWEPRAVVAVASEAEAAAMAGKMRVLR